MSGPFRIGKTNLFEVIMSINLWVFTYSNIMSYFFDMGVVVFPYVIFRTPCFSLNNTSIEDMFSRPLFNEALLLASPDLCSERKREEKNNGMCNQRIRTSLNKYASRAMTRSTPFGLFAGCPMVAIRKHMSIYLPKEEDYLRSTRLDVHYICTLVQYLAKNEMIHGQLRYYSNDSLYELGVASAMWNITTEEQIESTVYQE